MEAFAQSLLTRFTPPKEQKNFTPEEDARYSKGLAFYLLTENATNELHSNGIIARLLPESAVLVHDPNPFTRTTVKQHLAHQIADDYVKGLETSPFSNSSDVLHARRVQLANYAAPASGLK